MALSPAFSPLEQRGAFSSKLYSNTSPSCTDIYLALHCIYTVNFTGPVVELEPVTATLSSTWRTGYEAGNCIDGNTAPVSTLPHGGICITNSEATPWIAIDYGTRVIVERVEIFNRVEVYGQRTRNVDVRISDELPTSGNQMFSGGTLLGYFAGPATNGQHIIISGQKLL